MHAMQEGPIDFESSSLIRTDNVFRSYSNRMIISREPYRSYDDSGLDSQIQSRLMPECPSPNRFLYLLYRYRATHPLDSWIAIVAEWKNQGVGDLAHWSSMTWGGHWRQRIGVEIARGVARCVERAATTGGWARSGTGRGCSQEYDRDCC